MTVQIPLFQGIQDPLFQNALNQLPVRKYPKGIIIFEKGERSEEVYCILIGEVDIVAQDDDGELKQIALLQPGEIFGEFSYLLGVPRSTSAIAKAETTVIELGSAWLKEVTQQHPEVQKRLLDIYRSRVLVNILRASPLFSVLSGAEIEQFAGRMELKKFPIGAELIREGDTDLSLLVIKKGKVSITKRKGPDKIVLGELGTGEVLGEMALVTGEPRSASAHAVTEVEAMLFPGAEFKEALSQYPKLLNALEDIVRSRAEQTRRVLEQVIEEVVGTEWKEEETDAGILVDSLRTIVKFTAEDKHGEGILQRVSLRTWVIQTQASTFIPENGTNLSILLNPSRLKELDASVVQAPFPAKMVSHDKGALDVSFENTEDLRPRLSKVITALARARVRLFVYPEYDVSKKGITIEVKTKSGIKSFAAVTSLSQTNGRIKTDIWPQGELATITLHFENKEVLTTKALCLDVREQLTEFQFEYETGTERAALEEFLRLVSRQLGYSAAVSPAATPARTASRTAPILTKHFKDAREFLRTYMGSMESGLLYIAVKDPLTIATPVNIHLTISGERGVRRVALSGLVRHWQNGQAEVEIDELSQDLKEKCEQICKKLVEDRSEENWKKRKTQLVESGIKVPSAETSPLKTWAVGILSLGAVAFCFVWFAKSQKQQQLVETNRQTQEALKSEQPMDVVMQLETKDGPVQLHSLEVTSLKLEPAGDGVTIQTDSKSLSISTDETQKLTPFMKQQLERLATLQQQK